MVELATQIQFALTHKADQPCLGAPMLTGEMAIFGKTWAISLLVDTGADSTMINGGLLDRVETVYAKGDNRNDDGSPYVPGGVGGGWPARRFKQAELFLTTPDGRQARIELPRVAILSPFKLTNADGSFRECLTPPAGVRARPGRGQSWEANGIVHLLGRDVFERNGLALLYDPKSGSRVYAP